MNKNTLIALVLSLGILMVWSYFNKKDHISQKQDHTSPIFQGIKSVNADYKNGYIKLSWDAAKDDSEVTYGIFVNESKSTQFNNPVYYTTKTSFLINDLDLSKNYYFAVHAFDMANNVDGNKKQLYFKSQFKDKGIKEKLIRFNTVGATYIFSSIGGRLKNIVLKKYKTMDKKEQVKLVYYLSRAHSYYYPLDMKIFNSKDNYDFLKFNDMKHYSSRKSGNKIIFSAIQKDLQIVKEYIFKKDSYSFQLSIKLKPVSGIKVNYDRIALKWQPTLGPENKIDKYDNIETSYYAQENKKKVSYKKKNYNNIIVKKADNIKWVAFHNRYFVASIIPDEAYKIKETFFYTDDGVKKISGIISSIDPGKLNKHEIELNYTIYAGPKLRDVFKKNKKLNSLIKTISSRKLILGIGKFITKLGNLFLDVLLFINKIVKNYGLAIIIFTILIKLILYPLTHKQFESMVKMQKIQPVINQVKEQYKNEPQKLNKELMQVYKKYKVNPFGGCLPLILQMPIFFAIWDMLQYSLELRSASFLWVRSLALPDTIGYLGSIPINILPIIMGATMLLQQSQTGTDARQKSMMYFLPLIFLIFFWKMPSGLVLYWTIQNILSIGQQYLIKKHQKAK